ncbi:hypothetical protein AEM42_08625 [Betaproteobacteria bacterium UKL13-2]|nr:hypothetical protein AEM42_08625 [Betaproteobacteria bacterium UKL13-2]
MPRVHGSDSSRSHIEVSRRRFGGGNSVSLWSATVGSGLLKGENDNRSECVVGLLLRRWILPLNDWHRAAMDDKVRQSATNFWCGTSLYFD